MNNGKIGSYGSHTRRVLTGLSSYLLGLSLVYLLWGLLTNAETPLGVEYGFTVLAAFGAAGCLGHLLACAYRGPDCLTVVSSVFGGVGALEARRTASVLVESADWPLLVALLFGPFFALLAGLGGWV